MIKVLRKSKTLKEYNKRIKDIENGSYIFDFVKIPPKKGWNYWILVKNEFPYDKIAKEHDILVPRRFFSNVDEIDELELNELNDIKVELSEDYDSFMEGTKINRTVHDHFHIHCIKYISE